jgi:CRISPR-associated protein Cas1
MGTLYIDQKNLNIHTEGNCLVFFEDGERKGTVPIAPLERVVIIGNVKIETSVLHKLALNNVSCVFLSGRNLNFRGILHGRLHRNGFLRVKQYEKSLTNFSLFFARDLILTKLTKQLSFLSDLAGLINNHRFELTSFVKTINDILTNLTDQTNLDSLRGLEGSAAHSYFRALTFAFAPSLNFQGRNRRPPQDPVNSLLSLGYTLLHFELVREIETVGLDPTIGYFHSFEYGRESLACDLCEAFRPDIDRFVFELFRQRDFRDYDFTINNQQGINACYLKKQAKQKYFELYEGWAKGNRPLWNEKVRSLAKRIVDDESYVC